jgi:glycosyltransferase involved in cell wall biosynthesis
MRALVYVGAKEWSGGSRALLVAARGLAERGHQVTIAACADSMLARQAVAAGVETVAIDATSSTAGSSWDLRKVLKERFVEVVFVNTERDQLIVSSAMRLAERGAVIRRVASFEKLELQRGGKLAIKLASAGLLFTTERELNTVQAATGWSIPAAVAPLGVDVQSYDEITPASRSSLHAPAHGTIIACVYDPSGRFRIATVFRTLALLAPRHPDLHVVVTGPGSLDEDLRMHAAALGVAAFVSFAGDREDESSVLRAATTGWIVAGDDTAAYACLDLMAMRIPVITDRSPLSQHYVADGITGLLLAPGDPSYTASAVAAFLAHPEKLTAMGNAGRTRVQREFPQSSMVDGFEHAVQAAGDRTKWAAR